MRADASFALREREREVLYVAGLIYGSSVTPFLLVPAFYVRHLGSGVVVEVFLATIEESLDMCKLVFFFVFILYSFCGPTEQADTHSQMK
jgi:hypothetical protein